MISGRKKTLLLVEDEIMIAISEKTVLEKYGYEVVAVNSGKKAVETVKVRANIDLILMDIDLGEDRDGTLIAEEILQFRDIPVVFMSSHTEQDIVAKTEKITSYGYVVKDSGITVLDASIKMAFRLFEARLKLKRELAERERIETELNKSEIKYRSIMDQHTDMVYLHDLDGNLLDFSRAVYTGLGYSREELTSMKVFDLHPAPHDENKKDEIIRQWRSWPVGHTFTITREHCRKNGTAFPVEIRINKISFGNCEYNLALVRDITGLLTCWGCAEGKYRSVHKL